jgi:hypothetical protein
MTRRTRPGAAGTDSEAGITVTAGEHPGHRA